jgi:uncharacterized protein (TIRG00374 family)
MKPAISLAVSALILALIYWRIDASAMLDVLRNCNAVLLVAALAMVVPLTLITAWRFCELMPPPARVGFAEANRLILAASALNMVLPSKMGDLAKAWFMTREGRIDGGFSVSLVVLEKLFDTLALLAWCAFGLIVYEDKSGWYWVFTALIVTGFVAGASTVVSPKATRAFAQVISQIAPEKLGARLQSFAASFESLQSFLWPRRFLKVAAVSLFLWLLHAVQIWLFILALNAWTPFFANLALAPLAIFAGLLPLTFAGIGTRDAAAIFLYRPFFAAPTAAALGILLTSRYLMPALAGLPFLDRYLAGAVREQAR